MHDDVDLTHFCRQGDMLYAGSHLIIDIYDAKHLTDASHGEKAFAEAVDACGAQLLHMWFRSFGDHCGYTGVAVLAESHFSIHTWPEVCYAALDIFLCGNLDPYKCVEPLKKAFETERVMLSEIKRGVL